MSCSVASVRTTTLRRSSLVSFGCRSAHAVELRRLSDEFYSPVYQRHGSDQRGGGPLQFASLIDARA